MIRRDRATAFLRAGAFAVSAAIAMAAAGCGVEYPNCNGDQDCRAHHEVCVNRHCQQCRNNSDCGPHHRCLNNRCFEGDNACAADSDCPGDQHCVNNHCAPRTECDEHRTCPSGVPCVEGRCATASSAPPEEEFDARDNQGRLCRFEPVQFAYDNSQLDDTARHNLQSAADCLQRERTTRYVLIGRCDPRGTTEYNLALGQRRATIVQHYLTSLGVAEDRVLTSSEGSEGATGTDEASWAHDRRVDFRPRQ
jgi:peptidoglycan-associated lipoprotein